MNRLIDHIKYGFPKGASIGDDVLASVVVFLVALPLCMGIAVASGVPPALGLITGIVGGLVVGWIAGSPLQVSGPAAGLAVLVWDLVNEFGLEALGVAVLVSGLLQLVAGQLRLGRFFRATSPAVIKGMLSGIGVIIFAKMFHVMVDDKPRGNALVDVLSIPESVVLGLTPSAETVHHHAAIVGVLTLGSLVAWNTFKPKVLKAIPGPLVAVIVGVAAAAMFGFDIQFVSVPSDLTASFNIPPAEKFMLLTDQKFVADVLALALIASAETLLCASAVDQLHNGPRTRYDAELSAQGVGNLICGAVGALPMTGVIVRSSANVDAGGKTRTSAILHGIWLLALIVAAPFILELIPMSALAAILVFTGWKLLNVKGIIDLWKFDRSEAMVLLLTLFIIISTDLLTGVLVGLAVAIMRLAARVSSITVEEGEVDDGVLTVKVKGAATFVSLPFLAEGLEGLTHAGDIRVDATELAYIDHAGLELIGSWQRQHEASGAKVEIAWDNLHGRFRAANVFESADVEAG
ncbi:MAG: SulP family inorganic anion transporter [Myxococcota bacterium]